MPSSQVTVHSPYIIILVLFKEQPFNLHLFILINRYQTDAHKLTQYSSFRSRNLTQAGEREDLGFHPVSESSRQESGVL